METRTDAIAQSDDLVLVITRVFDAPRQLVFEAWTDPQHMVKWFGPHGFTSKVEHSELRAGGAYRIHMRGPEGDDHWTQGVFREVVAPERLVMSGSWTDAEGRPTGPQTLLTLKFEEQEGKTRLTLQQSGFESITARDAHRGGWTGSLERLADYLATI